jgi:hypothetical protein
MQSSDAAILKGAAWLDNVPAAMTAALTVTVSGS